MLLNFPKENFILPVSKNLIMFEKKRKGLAVLSNSNFYFVQFCSANYHQQKSQGLKNAFKLPALCFNGNNENSSNHFLANHKQKLIP